MKREEGLYGVEDSTGRNLLHIYGDEGLRRSVMGLLTRAEALPSPRPLRSFPASWKGQETDER